MIKLVLALVALQAAGSYPRVTSWSGSPSVVYENKVEAKLKHELELKLPFAVVTGTNDTFELRLNSFDRVRAYANTKLQVLEYAENGFVADFYMLDGRIRYVSTFRGVNKPGADVALLKTPFFETRVLTLADIIVELNMREPSIEVRVIEGVLPLEFFAFEKKLELRAGQKVKFIGEAAPDGSGIRYDYLLNNRKVPKGKMSLVEDFNVADYLRAEASREKAELDRKKAQQKAAHEQRRKQKIKEAAFLCKKPFGQKNDCAWWAEKGKCFRQRCNVNGQWGDKTERPMSAICRKDFYVTQCDY